MIVHTLTPAECREVLARVRHGRLACARSEQPYIVPISMFFDPRDNVVYGFTTLGQKVRWMRENPRVCLEVEEVASRTRWVTVIAFGRYEEIPRTGAGAELRRRATELFGREVDWWLPATASLSSGEQPTVPIVYRIRIGRITGRRAERDGRR
jgi:nitroimidazol reductase NimA-like FMN-containing flavoprotein (pyridoxamine 5'-phosphate oxidase superfamily)